jgi:hypothetical protein
MLDDLLPLPKVRDLITPVLNQPEPMLWTTR